MPIGTTDRFWDPLPPGGHTAGRGPVLAAGHEGMQGAPPRATREWGSTCRFFLFLQFSSLGCFTFFISRLEIFCPPSSLDGPSTSGGSGEVWSEKSGDGGRNRPNLSTI